MKSRRSLLFLAALVGCLLIALFAGLNAVQERDTGPSQALLEIVSHPADLVLSVAVTPAATLAEAHVLDTVQNKNYVPDASFLIARYESSRSALGRRAPRGLTTDYLSHGFGIRYARTVHTLRC